MGGFDCVVVLVLAVGPIVVGPGAQGQIAAPSSTDTVSPAEFCSDAFSAAAALLSMAGELAAARSLSASILGAFTPAASYLAGQTHAITCGLTASAEEP